MYLITTENTPIKIEPNIKFIQELIDDLDKAAERKILTYFKNLMKTAKPKRNNGYQVDVFWNCSSKKLTTEAVIGKTYFLLRTTVTLAMQEYQERYDEYETVKYKFFSDFHSVRRELKEDLKRFVLGDLSQIDFECESILGHPFKGSNFTYLECFSRGYFPLHIFSCESFQRFVLTEMNHHQRYSYFFNEYFRCDYDPDYIDKLVECKMKPIYRKMFSKNGKYKFPILDKVENIY